MLPNFVPMPRTYRIMDFLGSRMERWGIPLTRMDAETLHQLAERETGLNDFGDPYYREGLEVLLRSIEKDANLHFFGRFSTRMVLINYMSQRLLFVEAQKRTPDVFRSEINAPFIITGIPRSGTTILHRMMAVDPRNSGLPLWRLLRPFPPFGKKDSRQSIAQWELKFRRPIFPEMDSKHVIREDREEECIWMLGLTFHSVAFWVIAPVASFADWLISQNQQKYYQEYSLLLKVQQQVVPEKHLIMKAPDHMPNLGALLSAVPNARIVQLHRNPTTCLTSLNSLFYSTHRAVTNDINPQRLAEVNKKMFTYYLKMSHSHRSNPAITNAVLDVQYEQLVADPMKTVKDIYAHFGVPWSDEYEERLKNFLSNHPKDKHGVHHYTPEQFGQSADELNAHFASVSDDVRMPTEK